MLFCVQPVTVGTNLSIAWLTHERRLVSPDARKAAAVQPPKSHDRILALAFSRCAQPPPPRIQSRTGVT